MLKFLPTPEHFQFLSGFQLAEAARMERHFYIFQFLSGFQGQSHAGDRREDRNTLSIPFRIPESKKPTYATPAAKNSFNSFPDSSGLSRLRAPRPHHSLSIPFRIPEIYYYDDEENEEDILSIPFRIPEFDGSLDGNGIKSSFQFLSGFQCKVFRSWPPTPIILFQFLSGFQSHCYASGMGFKYYFQFLSGFQ